MLTEKKIAVVIFFIMFVFSGFQKIKKFNMKVFVLQSKIKLPYMICVSGMIGVIILELLGSGVIVGNVLKPKMFSDTVEKNIFYIYFAFLIIVTFLYHPPGEAMIPFLSNMTTFAGLLYIFADRYPGALLALKKIEKNM